MQYGEKLSKAGSGDQGKNRAPRDHNRDYLGESIYPEIAALRALMPEWSRGRLDAGFDLHCPWIRGTHNDCIYIVGAADQRVWAEQQKLGAILERVRRGALPYQASDNLPFGRAWNVAENEPTGMSCSRWLAGLLGTRLAASLEIPYAAARGVQVTAESARTFGADLARAAAEYLRGA